MVVQSTKLEVSSGLQYMLETHPKEVGSNVRIEIKDKQARSQELFLPCPLYRLPQDSVAQI